MSLPVERLSRLSLKSMSSSQGSRAEDDSAEINYESDIDASIDFDEVTGIARFPSGTKYSIHNLDPGTKDAVVKALSTSSKLALRGFSPRGHGYVFLVSETIEYHVRAPSGTGPYDGPSCSCQQDEIRVGLQHPCRHTLWLCDQILSQLVPLPEDPYNWRIDGYTTKHGNICDYISDFHFDVLADSLRCDVIIGESLKPRPRRIQTAREILATISGAPIETYRTDLVTETRGEKAIKEGDLEATIFRMLLENDSLLSYFLASMRNYELLNPKFRRFRDRADAALNAFDNYIEASALERTGLSKNPQWCYKTFKDISEQLKSIVSHSDKELDESDRRAAASALIYILEQVVNRNEDHEAVHPDEGDEGQNESQQSGTRMINLCHELIVESGHNFILDVLDELQLELADHLLPGLERIEQKIANTDIPRGYLDKLRDIISSLRDSIPISGSEPAGKSRKRKSEDGDRHAKRVK